jgi:ketosteroid isomerase-like protein
MFFALRSRGCLAETTMRWLARSVRARFTALNTLSSPGDHVMTERLDTEKLLLELYAARVRGDLDGVCAIFTKDATFRIAGASSNASPIAVRATGVDEFRPLLAIMLKTFKLTDQAIVSMLVDGSKAAVHWRVKIFSRITGTTVPTELVDVIEIRDRHIASYTEFFVPS